MAERLMGHAVAPIDTYVNVREIQPAAVLIFREAGVVTGVISALFLGALALPDLLEGRFDGITPDLALLTTEGGSPALLYSWGIAAQTKLAATSILGVAADVPAQLYPTITAFTRAVTAAGRRTATGRYGYRPMRPDDDEWLIRTPATAELAA
ncbi:MAG TPA: hypothetical protein VMU93_04860 [Caulobacteraceae bacterium]|nr:hypothetical protein [Caulobacteraceae bacterium]